MTETTKTTERRIMAEGVVIIVERWIVKKKSIIVDWCRMMVLFLKFFVKRCFTPQRH